MLCEVATILQVISRFLGGEPNPAVD